MWLRIIRCGCNSNEPKKTIDHAILESALSTLLMTISLKLTSSVQSADDIKTIACDLSLKDQAWIPAQERGLLSAIEFESVNEVYESHVIL